VPHDGTPVVLPDGRPGARIEERKTGCVMLGPSMPLTAGTYDFGIEVTWIQFTELGLPIARLEVVAGDDVFSSAELVPTSKTGTSSLVCRATIPDLRFGVHVRLIATGIAELTAALGLRMTPDPWR
jgi:hypothetical protein